MMMQWMTQFMNGEAGRCVCVVAAMLAFTVAGCSNKMSQAESDAKKALDDMGGIAVLDAQQVHVATLMLTAPTIQERMDEAIPLVAKLPYLTHLEVTKTNLTDEHMKAVAGLKRLTSLVLSGTQVGDAGLERVASRKLDTLYIDGTPITPAAMDTIGGIRTLKILDISRTNVLSNLSPLKNLRNLEWLILEGVTLDGNAIDVVSSLEPLRRFSITGSVVSASDLGRLKTAKPGLMIDGPGTADGSSSPSETSGQDAPDSAAE